MPTQVEAGYRKPRIQFTADGEQKEFHFNFTIYEPENVKVYIEDELQTSGYSLSQIKEAPGSQSFSNMRTNNVSVSPSC